MTLSARTKANLCGFTFIVALSSATMVWLFWHFPVGTTIATAALLAAFWLATRLSRAIETDLAERQDLGAGEQGA